LYLRRLEMTGFKSFPDSVQLEFLPGITAIVGPNGSGKSNIADAIRWVLGEHNPRMLRGNRMEDVIFGGSDTRRALSAADVTLVLDNSDRKAPLDYDEIRISRRVYRSGESEYLLNGSACRLKDIRDLFLDTGIGRGSYGIVEQGRVDAILSARSDERRAFFDEAAGVARCKARKQEALLKLDDVERNLVRVWDLINELSVRVETMREQAEKAEQYLSLRKELAELETGLLGNRYISGRERLQVLATETEKLRTAHAEVLAKLGKTEAELVGFREEVVRIDAKSEQVRSRLTEVVAAIERSEGRIALARERSRLLQQEGERLQKERGECERRLAQLQKGLDFERGRLRTLMEQASGLRDSLSAAEAEMEAFLAETAAEEEHIEQLKGLIVGVLSEMAECRNRISDAAARLESGQRSAAGLKERLELTRSAMQKTKADQTEATDELDRRLALRNDLERRLSELREMIGSIEVELRRLSDARDQHRRVLNRDESRLQALKDLDESREGFFGGVRAVLNEFRDNHGVIGPIADLIEVSPEHVVAIEAALGNGLQDIVAESNMVAKRCIEFLKAAKKGRATFLPLDLLRPPDTGRLQEDVKSLDGTVGLASSLVKFSEKIRPAIEYLLGRVVVATDLDAAIAAARGLRGAARIVTLDGDIISQGGAITGGSPRSRDQGVLARRVEMDRLRKRVEEEKDALAGCESLIEKSLSDKAKSETQLQSLSTQLSDMDLSIAEQNSSLQSLSRDYARLEADEKLLLGEISDLEQAISQHDLRVSEDSKSLDVLSIREKNLQDELARKQAELKNSQTRKDEIAEKITSLRVEAGRLDQEVRTQLAAVERLDAERAALKGRREELSSLEAENRRTAEETDVEHKAAERDRDRFASEKLELEQGDAQMKQSRLEMMGRISESESAVKSLRAEAAGVEKSISSREVDIARVSENLSAIESRLRDEYTLDPESLSKTNLGISEREAARTVESLRQRIRDMGPVNTGAVQEFKETQARYGFLCSQRDDLVEARRSLNEIIREIDEEAKKRFMEAFEVVNVAFREVFAKLFDGGRAHLSLDSPDDVLNTGIEIYAEPPGKKLQSLSLLSGGERSLTAIAFIFAMMKVNPSPFSVLDEIDAALDDSNVGRFSILLKELSLATQFVVVTHRKGTMEAADALYGVTMEESGVSKIVSVKLEE
jgi:chromosome segregation protein